MKDVCVSVEPSNPKAIDGGIEFIYWLAIIGKSRPTGFRWRRNGMITTVNIEGKLFVTNEEIARFWQRAKNGEFAKEARGAAARKNQRGEKNGPEVRPNQHVLNGSPK